MRTSFKQLSNHHQQEIREKSLQRPPELMYLRERQVDIMQAAEKPPEVSLPEEASAGVSKPAVVSETAPMAEAALSEERRGAGNGI